MAAVVRTDAVYAEANWGRWIANCPGLYCRSALRLDRYQRLFQCWDCGARAEIVWPPNVEDVETLLMMRPDPVTRNWLPGESLHDLLAQNMEHGILPAPDSELMSGRGSRLLLSISGDRIVYNELAAFRPNQQLEE